MKKVKLTIAYDGTGYSGWQVQPNATSIQTLIESALATALQTSVTLIGSGRTDAGVHALAQVAHFEIDAAPDLYTLLRSLNGLLPSDIRILKVEEADASFHARFSAKGKIYHYKIDRGGVANPIHRLYSVHVPYPLDLPLLRKTASEFVGTHDFTSFSNEAHTGSASVNPIRTIRRLTILEEGSQLTFEFEGDGFLYKMVRNCVGTLLDIARGQLPPSELQKIFDARDRSRAGACAPAKGLFLTKVLYP